jgi:hypothetical protein
VQVEPGAVPEHVQPGELCAVAKVELAGTVSRRVTPSATPVPRSVTVTVKAETVPGMPPELERDLVTARSGEPARIGVESEAVLFEGSESAVPSVAAMEAVLEIWAKLGGVTGERVTAKSREPLPATGTEPRLKVQTEPGEVPAQLHPGELWAAAKVVLAGTVSESAAKAGELPVLA